MLLFGCSCDGTFMCEMSTSSGGFSVNSTMRPSGSARENTQANRLRSVDRRGGDRHLVVVFNMVREELFQVHPVELVAGEDQVVLRSLGPEVNEVLAHRVTGALVPAFMVERLLGGEDLDEPLRERVEDVRVRDVQVQRGGVELREYVDLLEAGVDAVGQRYVDEAVLSAEGHGGLRAVHRERVEPRPFASAENDRKDVRFWHRCSLRPLRQRSRNGS